MRKIALALLVLCASALTAACASQEPLGTIRLAMYPGSEQETLGELTRLILEDRGYAVKQQSFDSLRAAHNAVARAESDLLWAYEWKVWRQALKHDAASGGAEELHKQVSAEDATDGIMWISAAPCVQAGSLAVRASNMALEDVQSISDLANHLQQVDPDLVLCLPSNGYDQPGGLGAMAHYYSIELPSKNVVEDSYEGCLGRVSRGTSDIAYALNTNPALATMDLRLLDDDRGFFQRSYLAVALSSTTLQRHPDLERTLKELAAVLNCQTLIDVQRQAMTDGTSGEQAARELLEDRRVIGSRRRRPTRVWE
ncbi:MAG: glycine betaine ABC transporter substrate-binding protein [Anaerolineae bacterium]